MTTAKINVETLKDFYLKEAITILKEARKNELLHEHELDQINDLLSKGKSTHKDIATSKEELLSLQKNLFVFFVKKSLSSAFHELKTMKLTLRITTSASQYARKFMYSEPEPGTKIDFVRHTCSEHSISYEEIGTTTKEMAQLHEAIEKALRERDSRKDLSFWDRLTGRKAEPASV